MELLEENCFEVMHESILQKLEEVTEIIEKKDVPSYYYDGRKFAYIDEVRKINFIVGMNENGFSKQLLQYIDEEKGTVVGVSAGSLIFADNLEGNLGLLKTTMKVHCSEEICEPIGMTEIHRKETIYLGNTQALGIEKKKCCII